MLFTSRPPLHTLSPTPTPLHTSTPINQSPCVNSVLGLVRLLGELYNYSVVSAAVIYEFLYTAINYGHRGGPAPDTPSSSASASSASAAAPAPAAPGATVASAAAAAAVTGNTLGQEPQCYNPRVPCETDPPNDLFRAQVGDMRPSPCYLGPYLAPYLGPCLALYVA